MPSTSSAVLFLSEVSQGSSVPCSIQTEIMQVLSHLLHERGMWWVYILGDESKGTAGNVLERAEPPHREWEREGYRVCRSLPPGSPFCRPAGEVLPDFLALFLPYTLSP